MGGDQLINPRAVLGYPDHQDAGQVIDCYLHALHDFAWGDSSQVGFKQYVERPFAGI
jgi:hypothetical protein